MQKTAEAVSLGHPDKIADYISSYILDRMIEQDQHVKYAVEVMIKNNAVALACAPRGITHKIYQFCGARWRGIKNGAMPRFLFCQCSNRHCDTTNTTADGFFFVHTCL